MPEWCWEIYEDDRIDMPVAQGRIRNGLAKTPQELLGEMIAINAAARWAYVDCAVVQPYDHDGTQKTVHYLSDGTRLRTEITPAA